MERKTVVTFNGSEVRDMVYQSAKENEKGVASGTTEFFDATGQKLEVASAVVTLKATGK